MKQISSLLEQIAGAGQLLHGVFTKLDECGRRAY